MIAESDVRIHHNLIRFGIENTIIGEEKFCLGSYAIPVMNTGKGLTKFFQTNINYYHV